MTEIEFLDPGPAQADGWQEPAVPGGAPADRRDVWGRRIRAAVPTALWVAAVALALLAPFRLVYSLSLRLPGAGSQSAHADGWGRIHNSDVFASQHETRYGIVEYVAAGLLVLAAALSAGYAYRRVRPTGPDVRLRIAAAAFGLAGTALLAGTLATALLYVDSVKDNINAEIHRTGAPNFGLGPSSTRFASHLGGMVWLTVAAVAVGVLALVAVTARAPDVAGNTEVAGPSEPVAGQPYGVAPESPPEQQPPVAAAPDPRDEPLSPE